MAQTISTQAQDIYAAAWRAGALALRGGDPHSALKSFRIIIEAGRADATVWLGMAMALRNTGDDDGEKEALDCALKDEPHNLRALMMKADHYVRLKDTIAASSYYNAVVRIGAASPDLPADLREEVKRASAACADHTDAYEAHLRSALKERGLGEPGTRRIAAALELMLGRTTIFHQQPKQFYLPELPQIQFYDHDVLPWLEDIDAATDDIREELLGLLKEEDRFKPYVEREADRPFFDEHNLLGDPSWSALFLWKYGEPVAENAARCPKTMEALSRTPLCRIPNRTPHVLFSLLQPGARIPPHHGLLNTRLICHLPIIVPEGCGFRVGNETRQWKPGKAFAFDDSIEHEAWNNSDKPRIILLFDVWRPELSSLERELIAATLQASDDFGHAGPR
jgi:aspartate beta-hydroxylase